MTDLAVTDLAVTDLAVADLAVIDESELVAGLKSGDSTSFDRVYEMYNPRLFGFLARMTGRYDVAEDLLQETWVRLAKNASRLRDDTQLGPWLFTVARNVYRTFYRWRVLDSQRIHELSVTRYRHGDAGSPFDDAAAGELQAQLERALAALPVRYREILLLVAVERMDPSHAAAVLGIKPDAARKRLERARTMIAAKLDGPSDGRGETQLGDKMRDKRRRRGQNWETRR